MVASRGRAALSAPWIFRDIWSDLTTGIIPPPPTIQQKVQLMRDHFRVYVEHRSERAAVIEFRKRVSWYAKQMHPCWCLKQDVRLINSAADFEAALTRFLEWRL